MRRILLPLSITVASFALGYGQGRRADVIKAGADVEILEIKGVKVIVRELVK